MVNKWSVCRHTRLILGHKEYKGRGREGKKYRRKDRKINEILKITLKSKSGKIYGYQIFKPEEEGKFTDSLNEYR